MSHKKVLDALDRIEKMIEVQREPLERWAKHREQGLMTRRVIWTTIIVLVVITVLPLSLLFIGFEGADDAKVVPTDGQILELIGEFYDGPFIALLGTGTIVILLMYLQTMPHKREEPENEGKSDEQGPEGAGAESPSKGSP